jgi:hypothetical protein
VFFSDDRARPADYHEELVATSRESKTPASVLLTFWLTFEME